jgi:hypothetical protein
MKRILAFTVLGLIFCGNVFAEYQGRYCEMDGAYTDAGETVYGECYIY